MLSLTNVSPKNVVTYFENQAHKKPDKIAIEFKDSSITYSKLNEESNKLANYLLESKILKDDTVALLLNRSIGLITTIFGTLKAGAAYLPINANNPLNRISDILNDSRSKILVTESKFKTLALEIFYNSSFLEKVIFIDKDINLEVDYINNKNLWNFISTKDNLIESSGWINSYNNKQFEVLEIKELVDNVVTKISHKLNKDSVVLEIGSGSGLIAKVVAPQVKKYICSDISDVILEKSKAMLAENNINNVEFIQIDDKNTFNLHEKVDVIVINSVVQFYFNYSELEKVILNCLDILNDDGIIFIGDIRDPELKGDFYNSLIQNSNSDNKIEIKNTVALKKSLDKDLYVNKKFFIELSKRSNKLKSVEFSNKLGNIKNELSLYRYDAILKKDGNNLLKDEYKSMVSLSDFKKLSISNPGLSFDQNQLAYVIYTSGSTGKPKGVMIEHGSLFNRLEWMQDQYLLNNDDKILFKTPYSFDVSVWEIFWWAMYGSQLVILEDGIEGDPQKIVDIIKQKNVSIVHFVPSMLNIFLLHLEKSKANLLGFSLKKVFTSGEALEINSVNKFRSLFGMTNIELHNLYGPTEATVDITYFNCKNLNEFSEFVPIGKSIVNNKVFIADERLNEVTKGHEGEIVIQGINLARGYLNNKIKTDESFVLDSHGIRTYKTGDLGLELLDGNIKYLGRKDNQIKIRGNRVELDEIKRVILENSNIENCYVIDSSELNEHKKIICFYISKQNIQEEQLILVLKGLLPAYAIPNMFIKVESVPTTIHGKLDRNKLLELTKSNITSLKSDIQKLYSFTQKSVMQIFEEHLKVAIDLNSNFFRVGGNSLLAMVVINEINSKLKIKLSISNFFNNPTPSELAYLIDTQEKKFYSTKFGPKIPVGLYPASHNQTRSFFLNSLENFKFYNIIQICELPASVNLDRLESVIIFTLKKHEIFKTFLVEREGKIYQKIDNNTKIDIPRLDFSKSELDLFIKKQKETRVDLSKELPIKLFFVKTGAKNILLINIHHAICDARSLEILNTQISELYLNLDNNINDKSDTYIDFTLIEREAIANGIDEAESFWKTYLNGCKDTKLPIDLNFVKNKIKKESAISKIKLNTKITRSILNFCKENDTTEFNFFVTVFAIFLSKVSGEKNVIIGTPIANRIEENFWGTIGYFANTIPIRFDVDSKINFKDACTKFKVNYLECMDNAFVPFDKIVDKIGIKRNVNVNPIFQTLFGFKEISNLDKKFILSKAEVISDEVGDMSLIFDVIKQKNGYELTLRFKPDLFLQDTIQSLLKNLEVLIKNILLNDLDNQEIRKILFIDEKQLKKILKLSTGKSVSFNKDKKLFDYILESARLNPDNIAIRDHSDSITYKEFASRIIDYASYLRKFGVKEGDFVPIITERNIDSLITMYSVMYCGAAYIPIVPEYPLERIKYVVENSKANIIINSSGFYVLETELKKSMPDIFWMEYVKDIRSEHISSLNIERKKSDIACVFYTSGSTGKPKGVLCTHSGYINIVDYIARKYLINKKTIAGHTSNFTFDISLGIMNAVFSKGGTLVLFSSDELKDPERIRNALIDNRINFAHFVPTILNYLNLEDVYLNSLASGAEKISPNLAINLSNKFNFFFEYGPTESSIFTTVWEKNGEKNIDVVPIGKPVDNTNIYILDENLNFVPIGTPGELYIAGVGVSKGYLNNPDKTKDAFFPDKLNNKRLMYKTGDIGRFIHDGNIVFLGRKDSQIKIGGYRIEIGEIENLVLNHKDITSCYVDVQTNDLGFSSIVLYYSANKKISSQVIGSYLKEFLPNYMIPSKIVFVLKMPNKVNGKIDVDKLRQIQDVFENTDTNFTVDQNIIKNIWCKVLNITQLDLHSDFFELGGSSLKILEAIYYLKKECGIEISVSDFYRNTLFKNFCDLIYSNKEVKAELVTNIFEKQAGQEIEKRDSSIRNKRVLLTGSTGFLGTHILKELISSTNFGVIYLLVRGNNPLEAEERVKKNFSSYYPEEVLNNVTIVMGDLSKSDLGLSKNDRETLKKIDLVINCSAKVQHLGKKEDFEKANVDSVKNILNNLNSKNLEFIQISTLSIFGKISNYKKKVYEHDLGLGQTFDNFYDETKFQAEIYLENFFKSGGKGGVFRLGNILNDSDTGIMQVNIKENAFTMMLQSLINTKSLWGLNDYKTNISPVNKCAELITRIIYNYELQGNVVNIYNPNLISLSELAILINQLGQYHIDTRENNSQIPEIYLPYLTNYLNTKGEKNDILYDNSNAVKLAEDLGFNWPKIDLAFVSKVIEYLKIRKIIYEK